MNYKDETLELLGRYQRIPVREAHKSHIPPKRNKKKKSVWIGILIFIGLCFVTHLQIEKEKERKILQSTTRTKEKPVHVEKKSESEKIISHENIEIVIKEPIIQNNQVRQLQEPTKQDIQPTLIKPKQTTITRIEPNVAKPVEEEIQPGSSITNFRY